MPPVVHIDISVPGHKDIVVAHEADHLQRKYQAPDLHNAINEAFRIAERRLGKYKDKLTDHGDAGSIASKVRVPRKITQRHVICRIVLAPVFFGRRGRA